jgi:ribosomal protein S18 acetylase RimI-like enzyme
MGLGSGLVMRLQGDLRAMGVDQLWVRVRVDNGTARSFFERLGFHPMGSIELHPKQPELRYARFI